jgi:hypothetical protein
MDRNVVPIGMMEEWKNAMMASPVSNQAHSDTPHYSNIPKFQYFTKPTMKNGFTHNLTISL